MGWVVGGGLLVVGGGLLVVVVSWLRYFSNFFVPAVLLVKYLHVIFTIGNYTAVIFGS
ncbi:MAG: hypothetical protein IPJ03_14825 [Ignavibacteriales bacterium]|nr:hypothetical protein [Ignavibacteriales bacterium]